MARWTIEVDDEVAERVAGEAAEGGVAPEQLAAELAPVEREHFPAPAAVRVNG